MTAPRTTFSGNVNPFTGRKTLNAIISDDPPPAAPSRPGESKYEELFRAMQVGQAIVCTPEEAKQYYAAMRHWLIQNGLYDTLRPRTTNKYKHAKPGTPQARVWLVEKTSQS